MKCFKICLGIATMLIVTITIILMFHNNKILIEELTLKNNELEQSLNETNEILESQKNEIEAINQEKEELKNNLQKAQEDYKTLEKKYKKELEPLAFSEGNLKTPSNATVNKLKRALSDTGLEGLEGHYLEAEQEYGVNAVFLMALTAQESAWGTSQRAREQNNLSGYAVYSDSSTGASFSSKEESIKATAKLLSEDYLNPNGKYFSGYNIYDVNSTYCPVGEYSWANNIKSIASNMVNRANREG